MIHVTDSREARWYCFNGRRRLGPFTASELCSLIAKGTINRTTLVRNNNGARWRLAGDVVAHQKGHARAGLVAMAAGGIAISVFFWVLLQENGQDPGLMLPDASLFTGTIPNDAREHPKRSSDVPLILNDARSTASSPNYPGLSGTPIDPFDKTRPELSTSSISADKEADSARLVRAVPSPVQYKVGRLAQEFWRSIDGSAVIMRYERYLRDYPQGAYADLAAKRIEELKSEVPTKLSDTPASKTKILRPSRKPQPKRPVKIVTAAPREPKGPSKRQCKPDASSKYCVLHNYSRSTKPSTHK
jgi:hypothetical protein